MVEKFLWSHLDRNRYLGIFRILSDPLSRIIGGSMVGVGASRGPGSTYTIICSRDLLGRQSLIVLLLSHLLLLLLLWIRF